jgi:allantoate deiminase
VSNVSAARIIEHCEALARLSSQADGLTRIFLSDEHAAANALVMRWMTEAGMTSSIDAIGNVVGRYEGSEDPRVLMFGSHLDTVRDAGRFDGMLGVVTAIECVRSLHERKLRLPFALEVIGFGDEEGVRFDATLLGSRAIAGSFDPAILDKVDREGISMREALHRFGLNPDAIPQLARSPADVLAYVELHIEQGPVLEAEGLPVGVVTAINGATRLVVTLRGVAGHAGTVPMTLRRDALAAAAECVLAIERRCKGPDDLVGTVGRIEARPGATNVIAGDVVFSVDVRARDDEARIAAVRDIRSDIEAIAARRSIESTIAHVHEMASTLCAPWLIGLLAGAVTAHGLPVRELPSGAGHDGMAVAKIADIGMLFVRCKAGVSHNPREDILPADAGTGAAVLLHFMETFAEATRR